jgi:hypothetical protein
MSNLVALYSDKPQSGKSVFAMVATDRFGYTRISFADPLKGMLLPLLADLVGHDNALMGLWGNTKEQILAPLGVTPRHIMQTLGTEWGRKLIHEDLWVKLWTVRVEEALKEGKRVVVDDMRFPNEMAAVRKLGGFTIKVVRSQGSTPANHASEGALSQCSFDAVMLNSGDLSSWYKYCEENLRFLAYA